MPKDETSNNDASECEFRNWYRNRYGEEPKSGCPHVTGRHDAWEESRRATEFRMRNQITELSAWQQTVLEACVKAGMSLEECGYFGPKVVVEALLIRNTQLALSMRPEKLPEHIHLAYKVSDGRDMKDLTTAPPMSAEEDKRNKDRRVSARRQIEDRRMERDLYKKFGE